MKKLLLFIPFFLFFLTGCAQVQECPECNCPICEDCSFDEEIVIEVEETGEAKISFIDVGHGDSILIQDNEQEVLIDCGRNAEGANVVQYIEDQGIDTLDYLILTHLDSEHIGGCDDVLKYVNVNTVLYNGNEKSTYLLDDIKDNLGDAQMLEVLPGRKFQIGNGVLEVLHSSKDLSEDNNSIVSLFTYGINNILLMSDCGELCEQEMISNNINADIIKVANHGSRFSTSLKFIESINPSIAIITTGINDYGHPDNMLLDRLTQENVQIYRTDNYGTISIELYDNKYEVK